MEEKILYKGLSYKINGLLFKVHNDLGRHARERQYGDALEKLLKEENVPYEREFRILHSDLPSNSNIADFVIDGRVLLELKAKPRIFREDLNQVLRYLQCSGLKLGMLVNFQAQYLTPRRIVNSRAKEMRDSQFASFA